MKDRGLLTIKGLAIIGVVFHHLENRRFDPSVDNAIAVLPAMFSWCVFAFFAVSGWLHAFGAERRKQGIAEFIKARTLRLLIPFAVLVVLYAIVWQLVQGLGLPGLGGNVPSSFFEKMWASIPPTDGHQVAEQLYFLPLLFLVCILAQVALKFFGVRGIFLLCAASFIVGLIVYPDSDNTGFSPGVGTWGLFSYTAGFAMYHHRNDRWLPAFSLGVALVICGTIGWLGLPKAVPVFLLTLMRPLRFDAAPFLPQVGEASATIYAYHTPFLLQPLVIAATKFHQTWLQWTGAVAAASIAIVVCAILFYQLRSTPARFILL
jgi:fucose 4-O-acetylase-like acetyltransferase